MERADIIVNMDASSTAEDIAQDILAKVKEAATKAIKTAGASHIKTASENVEMAYVLGDKKISRMYAHQLIPKNVRDSQTRDQNIAMAQRLQNTKLGMVVTGGLLRGLKVGAVIDEGLTISANLISSAPYSENLEWGILFGKHRPGSERHFFTKHLGLETIPMMISEFYKNLRSETD